MSQLERFKSSSLVVDGLLSNTRENSVAVIQAAGYERRHVESRMSAIAARCGAGVDGNSSRRPTV